MQWLSERAILAPTNETTTLMNSLILNKLTSQSMIYRSIDTVLDSDEAINYPVEFLNSIENSSLPRHSLELKIGAPIILIRNIKPPILCNGTRLSIKSFRSNLIEATIIGGKYKGYNVLIPRIPLIATDLIFQFKRLQFPIRLAFAMTVNKSQGQSLKVAGVNLDRSCFSHGQLYVACSRVGDPKNLFIYAPEQSTRNIVYHSVLQ